MSHILEHREELLEIANELSSIADRFQNVLNEINPRNMESAWRDNLERLVDASIDVLSAAGTIRNIV